MPLVDVIVIGAGLSGLLCARELQRANFSVVVLESRPRIGGRVWSTAEGTDLGGSWAWPYDSPQVLALGRELGVEPVPQLTDGDAFHVRAGGDMSNIGPRGASIIPSGPGAVRPRYFEMAKRLSELLVEPVRLGARVTSITATDGAIEVAYGQGLKVQGRRVVVALPPAVLANIAFSPPLPAAKLEKSKRTATWCGDWVKLALECKSPFWRETRASGIVAVASGSAFEVFWEGGDNALVGLGVGPKATAFAKNAAGDSAALRAHAVSTLSPVFPRLADELVSATVQAWALEGETYAGPGATERDYGHALLRAPTDYGLHFAGTETESHHGHVEGALVAARRAAREVVAALGASCRE